MFALVAGAAACTSNAQFNSTQAGAAASKEKSVASDVKGLATKTPPAGGTSMGMMSSPKAGNTTVPITNVEVYVFEANVDADPEAETLYWAATADAVYVWGEINLECVDDAGDPTGETGTAEFLYEETADGYGWMTSTDACGYSTDYGCSGDADGETCGGCDWNEAFIACSATSS